MAAKLVEGAKRIVVRLLQEEKAVGPMEVTLAGIAMWVRPEQPWKAATPMAVTLDGMRIELSTLQP